MTAAATQFLQSTKTMLYSAWNAIDKPCRLRSTVSVVALLALNAFSAYQNENSLWWGFSVGAGILFHKQIREGFSKDMSKISWKMIIPTIFVAKAYLWPVNWKVIAVFTGLNTGALWVEWGHWFNAHARET